MADERPTNPRLLSRTRMDLHVARRLREIRSFAGVSQIWLAEALAISTQAVQNYEAGRAGVPIIRLCQIAELLGVPPVWFFNADRLAPDWMTPAERALIEAVRTLSDDEASSFAYAAETGLPVIRGDQA